jgi:rRNA-processing protein FCF1
MIAQPRTKQLIFDTNLLIKVTAEPVPAFAEFVRRRGYVLVTISAVVTELRGLSLSKSPSISRKAINALRFVGSLICVIEEKISKQEVEADEKLFELAHFLDDGSAIATLDGNLLSRLESSRLPYFTLRKDRPFLKCFARATYLSTGKL